MAIPKVRNGASSNLPTVAERAFALICSEAGVACNRSSDEDKNGWDYIIQFDSNARDRRSRDQQRAGETAFVQVKSTASAPFKVQLKLSNALRMAKQRQPFFLVLVVDNGEGRRFLVRHFWTQEIEPTLQRVRQAEVSGHRDLLHTKTLTIAFAAEDDHTDDLLDWMSTTIRSVPGEYAAAKAQIAENIGFNDAATRVTASFRGPRDGMLDWELGIGSSPEVTEFTLFRERFGIELPDFDSTGGDCHLFVEPVGRDCSIMLRHNQTRETLRFAGKIFFSNLSRPVGELAPWRADFGCLTLLFRSGSLKGQIHIDFGAVGALEAIGDRLTLAGWPGTGSFTATLFMDAERAELGSMTFPNAEEAGERRELGRQVRLLQTIAAAQPGSDPTISIGNLIDATPWLGRFHNLFTARSMRIDHSASDDDDPTHAVYYLLRCDVGPWAFFALVKREVGLDTVIDGRRTVYLKDAALLEGYALKGNWSAHIVRIKRAFAEQLRAAGDPTFFWDLGDLEDWLMTIAPPENAA